MNLYGYNAKQLLLKMSLWHGGAAARTLRTGFGAKAVRIVVKPWDLTEKRAKAVRVRAYNQELTGEQGFPVRGEVRRLIIPFRCRLSRRLNHSRTDLAPKAIEKLYNSG